MISRCLNFRYRIVRDINPDITTPGRYVLGNKGHFQGLLVHSDGTVFMTTTHRMADNVAISPESLLHMQVEAVFRIIPQGCAERLTEGSGGSHLSAGAVSADGSSDTLGGGSCLLPELLNYLPSYYLSFAASLYFGCVLQKHEGTGAKQTSLERVSPGLGSLGTSPGSTSDDGLVPMVGEC